LAVATASVPFTAPSPPSGLRGWWLRLGDSHDRNARRAYRRSLPPLYRWRRVLIVVLIGALCAGAIVVTDRQPVRWATDRWYDVTGATENIVDIVPTVEPAEVTLAGSDPSRLVDGDEAAWSMAWQPDEKGEPCPAAPGTVVVLSLPAPRRILSINIWAGLPAEDSERNLQARPSSLAISLDGGAWTCAPLDPGKADRQKVLIEDRARVTSVRIGVSEAVLEAGGEPVLSITEIGLEGRPK
jgi:hypothetical protein